MTRGTRLSPSRVSPNTRRRAASRGAGRYLATKSWRTFRHPSRVSEDGVLLGDVEIDDLLSGRGRHRDARAMIPPVEVPTTRSNISTTGGRGLPPAGQEGGGEDPSDSSAVDGEHLEPAIRHHAIVPSTVRLTRAPNYWAYVCI